MRTIGTRAPDRQGRLHRELVRRRPPSRFRYGAWVASVALAILAMELVGGPAYLVVVTVSGLALYVMVEAHRPARPTPSRGPELLVVVGLYVVVVALLSVAFRGFGTERTVGLFLGFGLALVIGVAGPV